MSIQRTPADLAASRPVVLRNATVVTVGSSGTLIGHEHDLGSIARGLLGTAASKAKMRPATRRDEPLPDPCTCTGGFAGVEAES